MFWIKQKITFKSPHPTFAKGGWEGFAGDKPVMKNSSIENIFLRPSAEIGVAMDLRFFSPIPKLWV